MQEQYLLLVQQIQQNAAAIEQNLQLLYDRQVSYWDKKVVLSYARVQSQQIRELVRALDKQYRTIEQNMYSDLCFDVEHGQVQG
jgi:hypothetical protein